MWAICTYRGQRMHWKFWCRLVKWGCRWTRELTEGHVAWTWRAKTEPGRLMMSFALGMPHFKVFLFVINSCVKICQDTRPPLHVVQYVRVRMLLAICDDQCRDCKSSISHLRVQRIGQACSAANFQGHNLQASTGMLYQIRTHHLRGGIL